MTFQIPESVQALMDGPPKNVRSTCSQCRNVAKVFRCSRCQVAYYCSQACQTHHSTFHENICSEVASLQNSMTAMPVVAVQNGLHRVYSTMANNLVRVGYQESDTVENARLIYQKALYYLFELMKHPSLIRMADEDRVLILLGILGADEDTIRDWCLQVVSGRSFHYVLGPDGTRESARISAEMPVYMDFAFQPICMLVAMTRLARYRSDMNAFKEFRRRVTYPADVYALILPYLIGDPGSPIHLEQVIRRIRECIWSISGPQREGRALVHLRDTVPFSPEHADLLIRGHREVQAPPDYWHLVQDAFFLTPGVKDILFEFLPPEGDNALIRR